MFMMFSRLITFPWLANRGRGEGLGAAARSGGLPAVSRGVRMGAWSRLVGEWRVMQGWEVHGASTALKESSSPSDHTPRTLTVPPWTDASGLGLLAPGAPQAAAMTTATRPRSNPRPGFKVRISHPQTKSL